MPEKETQPKELSEQQKKDNELIELKDDENNEPAELSEEEMDEVSGGIIIIGGIRKGGNG